MNLALLLALSAGLEYYSSLFIGGEFSSAVADDSLVYVADGRGLSVFHRERLERLGGCMLEGETRLVERYGRSLFAGGTRGVARVDAEDCLVDRPKVEWLCSKAVSAMTISGDTLWFADAQGLLYGRDLATGSDLEATPLELDAPPVRIIPAPENLLLASDTAGLYIIELSKDDLEPRKIAIDGDPPVMDVLLAGDLAYLACAEEGLWVAQLKRRSAKVKSLLRAPGELTRLEPMGARIAAAAGTADFLLFSLDDPENPTLLQQETLSGMAADILPAERSCLVLTGADIVRIDIPAGGLAGGALTYRGLGTGWDIQTAGDAGVLAAGKGGIRTFKAQDSLAFLGVWSEPSDCRRVYIFGSQAYALTAGNIMYIADIKDPQKPERRTFVEFQSVVTGMDALGEMVLVAEQERGLGAWWRCPCGPLKEQGRWTTQGRVLDVAISEKLAFVSGSPAALYVIDWQDSTNLEEVTSLPLEHDYERLYLEAQTLYCLDSQGALGIINVARPTRPKELAVLELQGTPYALARTKDLLFIAAGKGGVHEVDISNPASPKLLETLDVGPATGVAISGELLLVLTPYSIESYMIKS